MQIVSETNLSAKFDRFAVGAILRSKAGLSNRCSTARAFGCAAAIAEMDEH
jgi:hypothetical protein